MSVYADDTFVAGPGETEVEALARQVLSVFPGKMTPPVEKGEWLIWDAPGADFSCCRAQRQMSLTMATHISKLAQKYDAITPESPPSLDEDDVARGEGACGFPLRELVGALQRVATVARPAYLLANYLSEPATPKRASAAMRVLRCLLGAKE